MNKLIIGFAALLIASPTIAQNSVDSVARGMAAQALNGGGIIVPNLTGDICSIAGSINYSDGTLLQCANGVKVGSGILTLGIASSLTGSLILTNSASAFATTIQAGNAAAARTWTWPTNFGSAGCVFMMAAVDGVLSCASPASGGVTSFSFTNGAGITGVVSNPTTTPTLSLTLGAITPSSVAIGAGSAITSSGAGGALGTLAYTVSGTGVATAAAINIGTAGAFVINGGALGTPSSGTLTNATGLPVGGISATGTPSVTTILYGDGTWKTAPVGSVTSVSVTTANGVSGTVATATTTPAITLTLGAITPTTVAVGGAALGSYVAAFGGTTGILTNTNAGFGLNVNNTNAGSGAFSSVSLGNDGANGAGWILNSSTRSSGGGANSATFYNDAGVYRFRAAGRIGFTGVNSATADQVTISTVGSVSLLSGATLGFVSSSSDSNGSVDALWGRVGAASIIQGGASGAGAGAAQTYSAIGSTGATMANVAFTLAGPDTSFAGTATGGDFFGRGGNATGASGARTGGNGYLAGGTGPTVGGDVILQTAATTTLADGLRIKPTKSVVLNNAAIATNATDGFLYIASGAGTPTGVPTGFTGRVALYYDTTNHQFWIYDGAWLQPKTPAGAAVVNWQ